MSDACNAFTNDKSESPTEGAHMPLMIQLLTSKWCRSQEVQSSAQAGASSLQGKGRSMSERLSQQNSDGPVSNPAHRTVSWQDDHGRDLASVREFEQTHADEDDADLMDSWRTRKACCAIM